MKDRKFKKNQKSKSKYIDPNSLKETEDSSKPYLKELAALAAILGTGATGAAILPNDRVYAAQTSVDAKSQIVGSVSESTQTDLSKQGHSKSDENGVRASNSEAKSMSSSSSKSLLISKSTSTSLSQSISHSQSTSRSVSLSNSQSQSESLSYSKSKLTSLSVAEKRTSTSHRDKSSNSSKTKDKSSVSNSNNNANASNSTYVGNFYSSENSSIIEKQSTDQSNLNDTTSLSLSNTQLIDRSLKIPVALQTSINKISTDNKEQLNKKQQLNELSLNGIFTNLVQTNTGVDVSNAQEFYNQVVNGTANVVNITNDIDLGAKYGSSTGVMNTPHSVTINGNGHIINFGNFYIKPNWTSPSDELNITFNDTKLYTANQYGAVYMNNTPRFFDNSKIRLVYNNVQAVGGTAVFADREANNGIFNSYSYQPLKTFEIKGNTRINGASSYTYNGTIYIPAYSDIHGTALISPAFNVVIDNGANVVLDAGGSAEYNIQLQGNWGTHTISIGDNAHVEMRGATWSNVYMPSYANGDNVINVGNNAYVDMTVPDSATDNIDFNYDNTSVNNTVNINPGAFVSLNGPSNFSSNRTVTININDPSLVFLKNSGGKAYAGNATYTINAQNTSIKTVDGDIITATPVLKSNTATIKGTNVQSSNTVFLPNEEGTAEQVAEINSNIVKRRITEYQGYTANSESVSMSESLSNSVSMSESLSNSVSMSESLSNSVSMSESLSNSVSMSESLSNSVSLSESLSNSVSMSESLSNSVSMSESLSNSVSMSDSLSNSVSMSESLSNSVSMSESLSNSVSMSESLSNSVSMSESLSNSVSMSESLSNSVSMSESLSNSVSLSESLSNSVSMSESQSSSTRTITSTNSTNNNGSKVTPNNSGAKSTISTNTLKSQHENAESVDKTVKRHHRRGKLPQTGAESSSNLLGLMITALGGLLGFRRKKRKDEDKDVSVK